MTEPQGKTRVVKVGGSLLENADLSGRLKRFMADSPDYQHIVVVGGGRIVDCIREWQAIHNLTNDYCHWASVRLMSETARMFAQTNDDLRVVESLPQIPKNENCILDCWTYVESQENLDKNWSMTSDSIAARVAISISADEFWLFKSILPDSSNMKEWRLQGIVDANFPQFHDWEGRVFIADGTTHDLLSIEGT